MLRPGRGGREDRRAYIGREELKAVALAVVIIIVIMLAIAAAAYLVIEKWERRGASHGGNATAAPPGLVYPPRRSPVLTPTLRLSNASSLPLGT